MKKELMLGNKAFARGAYEAGVKVVSSYPGTPSTEITEETAKYNEMYSEWAPNEKVALEVAIGSSVGGARSLACMKHVGLNVAADPLFTVSYTGVNGGLVIVVADDPGMHSSQNEQDSRFYARSSFVPMLEPSSSLEAKEFMIAAYELSENFDTPVFLRTTTRLSHSQGFVPLCDRKEVEVKDYKKKIEKFVMMPGLAKKRHIIVEKRTNDLMAFSDSCELNREEMNDTSLGIVCSGVTYQYVKEVLPAASIFKIGMVYPMPIEKIRTFSSKVKRLVVIEDLEPFFENQLKANGISCEGKNLFSCQGEILENDIRSALLGGSTVMEESGLPNRPPVMCAGCPHRGVFYTLSKQMAVVTGDIGCYTLGAIAPLFAVDTVVCMGASVPMNHGMEKARGREFSKKSVAVIGDSTFMHSGITGLINSVYNKSNTTLMILDNSTTGMTGHQDHPATGKTAMGDDTYAIDIAALVKSIGVKLIDIVDAFDLESLDKTIKKHQSTDGVTVIIAKRPCVLKVKDFKPALKISNCKNCKMCMKLGCPALISRENGVAIDESLCVGCGLCKKICKFGAISGEVK